MKSSEKVMKCLQELNVGEHGELLPREEEIGMKEPIRVWRDRRFKQQVC